MLEPRLLLAAHIVGSATSYPTIQAAVDAAAPGATVNVDAGSYPELVTINKPLTLRGAQAGVDARGNIRQADNETIVNGTPFGTARSSAFYINANDVTLDGFTVQDDTSNVEYGAGVVIAPGRSGTHLFNNIIQNNVSGLFLANTSSTDPTVIRYNLFRNNNNAGANGGRGIYTDASVAGGNLTNVTIDSNAFFNNHGTAGTTYLEAAIALEGRSNSQSNIRITNNVFDENGKTVLAFNASNILIQGNVATGILDLWSGCLRFEGNVHICTITDNSVYDNTGLGVHIDSKGFVGDSSGFVITRNNFYHNSTHYHSNDSVVIAAGIYDGPLDARGNWWGDVSGPGGDYPGNGDNIYGNGNNVTVSPWATAPVVPRDVPYWGIPTSPGAPIQIEDYDHGGEGIAYHDTDGWNYWRGYRPVEGVDLGATNDAGGGFFLGPGRTGEWVNYTVNIPQSGTFNLDFRVANGQTVGGKFHLECDGQNVTSTIVMPNTGGDSAWQTITTSGVTLPAGTHVLRLVMDTNGNGGGIGYFNWFRLTSTGAPAAVPAAPSNLVAAAVSPSQINLNWQDNSGIESGFKIDRSSNGSTFTTIATVAANVTTYSDVGLTASITYFYRVRATSPAGDSGNSNVTWATTPAAASTTYLSDLPWASATAGWGTIHLDASIVGNPLTLRGVTYAKGIGTHAISQIVYNLNGQYNWFLSDVGIDDEELTRGTGTVDFQVIGDGKMLFDSGVVSNSSPTVHINVSVAGVQQLTLLVGDGGDGIDYDHADWAGARLIAGASAAAAPASAVPSRAPALTTTPTLPAPWRQTDIGAVARAGTALWSGGNVSVIGSGAEIGGTADAGHFVYQQLTGNGTIIARVNGMQNTSGWAKAGILLRDSLAAGAKEAGVFLTPASGLTFVRRASTSGAAVATTVAPVRAPYWVKLVRARAAFSAYCSPDGIHWTLVGWATITFGSTVYVGLAVTAHSTLLNTSTFDHVSVTHG